MFYNLYNRNFASLFYYNKHFVCSETFKTSKEGVVREPKIHCKLSHDNVLKMTGCFSEVVQTGWQENKLKEIFNLTLVLQKSFITYYRTNGCFL